MRGGGLPEPVIEDGEAIAVDSLVSQLKETRPAEYNAVVLHYLAGMSYRDIAKHSKRHHRQVADLVRGGVMWIEGAIQSTTSV
jgi:DNA-directed RNA polymerase specialized sigma24 family protein